MARTGIRLFVVMVVVDANDEDVETGEAITSFDTDRRREILLLDVGVSERIQGIDACVFVLLNDDVEPPVDVD